MAFTERDLRILEARCPTHPERIPLSTLGREFDVTPERVRQIDRSRRRRIAARLESSDCFVLMHHATRMRRTLGTFVPSAALEAALQPLLPSGARHPMLCRDIVLEHAGPYRFEDGFWQIGDLLPQMRAALAERPSESWTVEDLDRLMDDAGVAVEHRVACRAALSVGANEVATPTQMSR